MPIRKILIWPDTRLEEISDEVDINDDHSKTIEDLIDTMHNANGVGLSAPQIGILDRIVVIDESISDELSKPLVMINPEIIDGISDIVSQEGCLSIPDLIQHVPRAGISIVKYYNEEGRQIELTATGMLSIAIQHEVDHLDGELIVDRMNRNDKRRFRSAMIKSKKEKEYHEVR